MKTQFLFIPAIHFDKLNGNIETKFITFFGSSGNYIQSVCNDKLFWIIYDGWHVATKRGSNICWNPEFKNIPKGFKTAVKNIK